tara:strand:- start:180 stop:350 length:171 start_codon:yes stop_codon:yes gene_type:complete
MVKEKVKDKVLSKKEALEKAKEDYANNPTITFKYKDGEFIIKGNPFNEEEEQKEEV